MEQCTFFLLLNLSLIICAAALNFYCAPNHFVFGGNRMKGLNTVLHLYKDASNYTGMVCPADGTTAAAGSEIVFGVDLE